MKFLYRDILISVFPFIVHCVNSALHVIMLLLNNKFVAYDYLHSNVHGNFRLQVHIVIYIIS